MKPTPSGVRYWRRCAVSKIWRMVILAAVLYIAFQGVMLAWNWDYLTCWQDPAYLAGERTATYHTWGWPL